MFWCNGHLIFINQFLHKWHSLSSTASGLKDAKIELDISWFYQKWPHDDDLNSLFDLKKAKNASALDTEWFSWPQPPWQPLFVGLIIKNPVFLWYLALSLSEAVEASLWPLYEIYGSKVKCTLLLNMPLKKNQQNHWSFYPSEPFTIAHFNVRHLVVDGGTDAITD